MPYFVDKKHAALEAQSQQNVFIFALRVMHGQVRLYE